MGSLKGISWVAPTAVLCGLLAGVLFAIGHHIFYSNLAGQVPPEDDYHLLALRISKQEVNIAAGTAFAFLVNASLGVAVSVAYVQVMWRKVKTASHGIPLGRLDDLVAAMFNPATLLRVLTWCHFPLLFTVAFIGWLLPLAAIITPATLSVKLSLQWPPPVLERIVPNVDFATLAYTDSLYPAGRMWEELPDKSSGLEYADFQYNGPSNTVLAMTEAVVATGMTQAITPPRQNVSWAVDFPGPALNCSFVTGLTLDAVKNASLYHGLYSYMSWSTGCATTTTDSDSAPCRNSIHAPFYKQPDNTMAYNPGCYGLYNNISASLFMAIFPRFPADAVGQECLLQCDLTNKTYHTNFSYVSKIQQLDFHTTSLEDASINAINGLQITSTGGSVNIYNNSLGLSPEQLLRRLSYQGIFDAFQQQFVGYTSYSYVVGGAYNRTVNSSVTRTVIGSRPELNFLQGGSGRDSNFDPSFKSYFRYPNFTAMLGIHPEPPVDDVGTLPSAMENLFEKVVISLMSASEFNSNTTSPFALPPVNVTHYNYITVYAYSAEKLWLAYGLAICFAALVAALGAFALLQNGASYSLSFSTIFRLGRYASMSEDMKPEDTHGRDPLPSYLAKTKLWFHNHDRKVASTPESASIPHREPEQRSLLLKRDVAMTSNPVQPQVGAQPHLSEGERF